MARPRRPGRLPLPGSVMGHPRAEVPSKHRPMGWLPSIYLGRLSEARRREIGRVVSGAGTLDLDGDDVVWSSAGERRGVELEVELGHWVSVAIAEARAGGENRRAGVLERAADDLSLITEQEPVKGGSGGWVCELSPVGGHRSSIVWSSHTTELGAQRARSSLAKAWTAAQPHQLRGRWEWSTAPGSGRTAVFRSRAEAVAAAGGVFYDATPSAADPDVVVASRPTDDSFGQPRVDITVNGTSIGRLVDIAGRGLYEITRSDAEPSHRSYLRHIINLLFGRGPGDGVQLVTGPASDELDQLLTRIAGRPGTAWSIPITDLRHAFQATGHFHDLNTLGTDDVGFGGPEVGATPSSERSAALSDPKSAAGVLIGYARCSTVSQDLDAQRAALEALGVEPERIYLDEGLSGASRDRPGLDQALAAVRAGDTLVVPELQLLARSVLDARAIADQLVDAGVALSLAGQVYNPADPMGKMFFNTLAMIAESERALISERTREGMAIASKAGKLRGRRPSLTPLQDREIRRLHDAGEHTGTEIAEIFKVSRATIYRSLNRTTEAGV